VRDAAQANAPCSLTPWEKRDTRAETPFKHLENDRMALGEAKILSDSSVSPLEWLRSQCPCDVAKPLRNYLNCGIVGALMRGGAIGATLEAFPIPLGSTNISSAPIVAAFGRPPPKCPIAAEPPPRPPPPPPRANEAAGVAKTMNNAIATFTEVFDMGSSTNIH
jgi:hypothetical protein